MMSRVTMNIESKPTVNVSMASFIPLFNYIVL